MALTFILVREASASVYCRAVHNLKTDQLRMFETTQKKQIVFETHGNEQAETQVVFLNGIDKDLSQWTRVRQQMQIERPDWGFTQIDLLGQGKTSDLNPSKDSSIPFQEQVAALKQMILDRGLDQKNLILIGHSYGGGIAARLIKENPGMVRETVLISPFVDHLETHQVGVGPIMWWMKQWSHMTGMKALYDMNVQMGSDMGTMMTWPVYSFWHASGARVTDVMALSKGIRDLNMDQSVSAAGTTRIHMLVSQMDELIPTTAHSLLWARVPKENRGRFGLMVSTHESVTTAPGLVSGEILKTLSK
jgi:pimeloyl-ACP methyl ester carboxylesterase